MRNTANAWRTIAEFIEDPARVRAIGDSARLAVQIQELAALRETITTDLLFKVSLPMLPYFDVANRNSSSQVGKITDSDEVVARINAAQPLYIRDHAAISGLVTSLRCLSTSANTRDPKVTEEGTLLDFDVDLTSVTIKEVRDSLGKPAPSCVISYSGKAPIRRGPSDNNPSRTFKLTTATRESAAIHPVSETCLPSAKLSTKRASKELVASRKKPCIAQRVWPQDSHFYDGLDLPLDPGVEDEDYADIWAVEKTTEKEPIGTRSANARGFMQRYFSNSSAEVPQPQPHRSPMGKKFELSLQEERPGYYSRSLADGGFTNSRFASPVPPFVEYTFATDKCRKDNEDRSVSDSSATAPVEPTRLAEQSSPSAELPRRRPPVAASSTFTAADPCIISDDSGSCEVSEEDACDRTCKGPPDEPSQAGVDCMLEQLLEEARAESAKDLADREKVLRDRAAALMASSRTPRTSLACTLGDLLKTPTEPVMKEKKKTSDKRGSSGRGGRR